MLTLISAASVLALVFADAGFVSLPITAEHVNATSQRDFSKNSKVRYIPDKLQNGIYQYFVTIDIGTPSQPQKVSIDTGSSDLWVYQSGAGSQWTYSASDSSTSQYVNDDFQIQYVDGSGAQGPYYRDTTTLGGATVPLEFGVNNGQAGSNTATGVFGIASDQSEAVTTESALYPNYPVVLKQQGLTESVAYSLYLDDLNAQSGTIVFGGVDTSKYSGQLYTVPITSSGSFNVDFSVAGYSLNGVLDAGTSLTYIPDDIVSSLAQKFGAQWNNQDGLYETSSFPSDASVTYSFSGAEVTVGADELFISNGDGTYSFTILPYSESQEYILLGDSFLRSAYVVYDLDNNQIGIAQAEYTAASSITPITSSGIPNSQPAPGN